MAVHPLEVVLLAARPGDGEAELEEDGEAGKGEDPAYQPEDEAYPDRAC